jgi:hypothetical protein
VPTPKKNDLQLGFADSMLLQSDTLLMIHAAAGGSQDRAKLAEIMRRQGLTPAPPAGGF